MKNTKRSFIVAVSVFILLCSVVLLIRRGTEKRFFPPPVQYSIDEQPFLPAEPGLQDSYIYTNALALSWTEEQGEVWFSPPEGRQLEQLENSNDVMVRRILESVP